jgi:hypothetical protein
MLSVATVNAVLLSVVAPFMNDAFPSSRSIFLLVAVPDILWRYFFTTEAETETEAEAGEKGTNKTQRVYLMRNRSK